MKTNHDKTLKIPFGATPGAVSFTGRSLQGFFFSKKKGEGVERNRKGRAPALLASVNQVNIVNRKEARDMKRFLAVSALVLMLLFPAGPVLAAYTITVGPFGFEFSDEVFPFYVFLSISLTLIALFLIFRAIVLWYWKINKIVETLQGILDQLRMMNRELEPADSPGRRGESEMDNRAEPKVG